MQYPAVKFFQSLSTLSGVGPKRRSLFQKLSGDRIIDLLLHLPQGLQFRTRVESIKQVEDDSFITLEAYVVNHREPRRRGMPYTIDCEDRHKNHFQVLFFHTRGYFLSKQAPIDKWCLISGKVRPPKREIDPPSIMHPDFIGSIRMASEWIGSEPVYPLTTGLTQNLLLATLAEAQGYLQQVEWLPDLIKEKFSWGSFPEAVRDAHFPETQKDLSPIYNKSRQRLIFDEFFSYHLGLLAEDFNGGQETIEIKKVNKNLFNKWLKILPYELTKCQADAVADIEDDMTKKVMIRLLQGDVGAGKTFVAFAASLFTIAEGKQAAILVPTDILAQQHSQSLQRFCKDLGLTLRCLTSKTKPSDKRKINDELAAGVIDLLVGTHAIFQEKIQFKNLDLVVIDEQHRFGVEQRLLLAGKGDNPHILSMTATPIPRTLQLANYSGMDVSRIKEKPPGRKPISTKVINSERLSEVITALKKLVAKGEKIFWICPLIEETKSGNEDGKVTTSGMANVMARAKTLQTLFGDKVALLHGRMKSDEKIDVMENFKNGDVQILVSTTVVEVGVDVRKANVMVIECAERFGLSQLHQLRGRVGRGDTKSMCLLIYTAPLSFHAKRRLENMRESDDGFFLAEQDLRLRGSGDVIGTKQSGLPPFKLANFKSQYPEEIDQLELLFREAHNLAKKTLDENGTAVLEQEPILTLMRVFGKDRAVAMKKSG